MRLTALFNVLLLLACCTIASAHWPTALDQVLTISAYPTLVEDSPGALPLDNDRTLVFWRKELTGNQYQILDRFGNFSFSAPRHLSPAVVGCYGSQAVVVPDGQGGALAVWGNSVSYAPYGSFAQRVSAAGNILWGDSAVKALPWPGSNVDPAICSDGQGGAFVAASRSSILDPNFPDIYMQHITAAGQPVWGDSGLLVISYSESQVHQQLQPDGQGGCYLVWWDTRVPYNYYYAVFAQRFNAQGQPLWNPVSGIFLGEGLLTFRTAIDDQGYLMVLKNGGTGSQGVLYRVSPHGSVLWSRTGLCINSEAQLVIGEPGFVYLGWYTQWPEEKLMAQRVDLNGQTYWPTVGSTQGIVLSQITGFIPSLMHYSFQQGAFFAFFTLSNQQSPYFPQFVRTQKLNTTGERLWGEDGVTLIRYDYLPSSYSATYKTGVPDGAGGLVGIWEFRPTGNAYDIVAKHVNADSSLGGPFPVTITLTPHNPPFQIPSTGGNILLDMAVAETDRVGGLLDLWIEATLPGGRILEIAHRENLPLAPLDTLERFNVTQMVPANAPAGTFRYTLYAGNYPYRSAWGEDSFTFVKQGSIGQADVNKSDSGQAGMTQEGWTLVSDLFLGGTRSVVSLSGSGATPTMRFTPNPFNATIVASFELRAASYVSLKVYDTAGRVVTTLVNGWREAGNHEATFNGSNLASGIYLVRLETEKITLTRKILLLK